MNKFVISYASNGYYESQRRFNKSINQFKQQDVKVLSYTDNWLRRTNFYTENKCVLDQKRGAGYWLWKPYILLSTFEKMKEGDILIYCDADAVVVDSFNPLFEICAETNAIMLFDNSIHLNKTWIKRDCFILMDADEDKFYNAAQAMGGFIVLKKNEFSQKFLQEWLAYAKDYRISTDAENELGKPNLLEFKEHRHDQAILSILSLKWNLSLYRDPSQFGNPYKMQHYRLKDDFLINNKYLDEEVKMNSPYGTLINLQDPALEKRTIIKRFFVRIKKMLKRR